MLSSSLMDDIDKLKSSLVIEQDALSISIPPAAIDPALLQEDGAFAIRMNKLSLIDAIRTVKPSNTTDGLGLFRVGSFTFEFSAEYATADTSIPITQFKKPLSIIIPLKNYNMEEEDKENLGVFYYNII